MGTAALGTATLAALRARRPDAHVTVAAAWLTAELLRDSPLVDELIVTPHALNEFPQALGFALTNLRRHAFDYVAVDAANARTKIAAIALASGARTRVGFTPRPELFHVPLAAHPSLSNLANNLRLLDAIGLPGPAVEPEIYFSAAALESARALLGSGRGPRIAMVTQTSQGHPNAWFDDRWAQLSQALVDRFGANLVFIGTASDAAAIERLRSEIAAPTQSVAGRTHLPLLAALLTQCDLAVTLDTGTLHVARAVNTPTVVLGHAANPKHLWLPLDQPAHRILHKAYVPCAHCRLHTCATRECMQEITVQEVVAAADAQLRQFPPSSAARAARAAARLAHPEIALAGAPRQQVAV